MRIVIDGPLEVTQAPVPQVMATVRGRGLEALGRPIRDEEGHASRAAMHERGLERLAELAQRKHVVDRIVDEDGIELTPKADLAHIAADMRALRIQGPAEAQHPG